MESFRFLLLDFGHPMNVKTIKNIINSFENVFALSYAFSQSLSKMSLGISVLNSNFVFFQSDFHLPPKYNFLFSNLRALSKKPFERVTVQEYKQSLRSSILGIFQEFQSKLENPTTKLNIQLAVISKKTASVLADILTDVTDKLEKDIMSLSLVKNYKIIQILNENEEKNNEKSTNPRVHFISCSDDIQQLNSLFKLISFLARSCDPRPFPYRLFLRENKTRFSRPRKNDRVLTLNGQQRKLRLFLSKESQLEIHCEVEDCVLSSISCSFNNNFGFFNSVINQGEDLNLEIINRIPVNALCPTLVFGTPRRLYATSCGLTWMELKINSKVFRELCRTLNETGQGLLAKTVTIDELTTLHFLTSDGDVVLLNDVATNELHLPKRIDCPVSCEDKNAVLVIQHSLEKIQFLPEYDPQRFSSGLYDHLRSHLKKTEQNKTFVKRSTTPDIVENDNRRKKLKLSPEKAFQNVHPALLPPKIVQKYRKIQSQSFRLPELDKQFTES